MLTTFDFAKCWLAKYWQCQMLVANQSAYYMYLPKMGIDDQPVLCPSRCHRWSGRRSHCGPPALAGEARQRRQRQDRITIHVIRHLRR